MSLSKEDKRQLVAKIATGKNLTQLGKDAGFNDRSVMGKIIKGIREAKVEEVAAIYRDTVPELLEAVRNHVVVPRQAIITGFIAEGIAAGEIRPDIDPFPIRPQRYLVG